MLLSTTYINDEGYIKNLRYKISHNITNADQLRIFENIILPKYNDNVLIIRGISEYGLLNATLSNLKTTQFDITLPTNGFNFINLPEPAFGSAQECVSTNLSLETQIECQKIQSYFDGIRIKLIPEDVSVDSAIILLNEVRSNGIYQHVYELTFSFADDWSSTCDTCKTGMQYLTNELTKFSNELYIVDGIGEYSGRIINDLTVNNISVLKEQITLLLSNALTNARISDFTIKCLNQPGELGDETEKSEKPGAIFE